MELKRYYVPGSVAAGTPKVSHVRVRRTTKLWNVSPTVLEQGAEEGWLAVADGKVSLKTEEGKPNVVFKIVSRPGHYCCHCPKKLNDSREGALHIAEAHAGAVSPDQGNPAGWRRDNHYTLELESGAEAKPEVPAGQRLRYFAQQEARREGARNKIAERDAKAKAPPSAA